LLRAIALGAVPTLLWAVGVLLAPFHRKLLVDLAAKNSLPTLHEWSEAAEVAGLLSYGPNLVDMNRRTAYFVDRILRGATPADLPIEKPTKFELVVNRRSAKALGLTIPPTVLLRADTIIQ
jgi:putative ABC transport system substrate-binding protein